MEGVHEKLKWKVAQYLQLAWLLKFQISVFGYESLSLLSFLNRGEIREPRSCVVIKMGTAPE